MRATSPDLRQLLDYDRSADRNWDFVIWVDQGMDTVVYTARRRIRKEMTALAHYTFSEAEARADLPGTYRELVHMVVRRFPWQVG